MRGEAEEVEVVESAAGEEEAMRGEVEEVEVVESAAVESAVRGEAEEVSGAAESAMQDDVGAAAAATKDVPLCGRNPKSRDPPPPPICLPIQTTRCA
jgi:hypothetical protein